MKITLSRSGLLKPLTYVSSVVEKRQTLPILSNVLLQFDGKSRLNLTGTDLEVEVITYCDQATGEAGELSINARKLFDITRALPEDSKISISTEENGRAVIRSGKSRFTVQTLPVDDFPKIETEQWSQVWKLPARTFKQALTRTAFAMAQQDVRFYLNGLLLVSEGEKLKTVATDGHRLAKTECPLTSRSTDTDIQAIVPRKAITELNHIMEDSETEISVNFNLNHIRVELDSVIFTSKLIDGRFPDYEKVIPKNQDKSLIIDRIALQNTLNRAAILTNEKFRGVRLIVNKDRMSVSANNPDQEEAFDEIDIEYTGDSVEIGFNVGYMLEALN
ncbi:MAG: DNA polymerase III subunit beta, partial [Gammaproteobacteria bacterium]|nr:DNA polymerase III subunit beta [Gammaproteobacteria bacterium]